MVGIEKKLFQAATVAVHLIRDCLQAAMPLVHRLDVAIAAPQGDTLQHLRPPWGDLVAGATEISASEDEGRRGESGSFLREWAHSMSNHLLCSHDDPEREAEIHLEAQK